VPYHLSHSTSPWDDIFKALKETYMHKPTNQQKNKHKNKGKIKLSSDKQGIGIFTINWQNYKMFHNEGKVFYAIH
jgi:hypothetical protein